MSSTDEQTSRRWPLAGLVVWYLGRRRNSRSHAILTSDARRSPLEECDELIATLQQGANQQMRRAQVVNLATIGASASIPVFLLLSTQFLDFYLGKLAPALLAAFSTGSVLILQLTKPHERWQLLRLHQRVLEIERFRYEHRLRSYVGDDRDIHLLEQVAKSAEEVANAWAGLMPESERATQIISSSEASGHVRR